MYFYKHTAIHKTFIFYHMSIQTMINTECNTLKKVFFFLIYLNLTKINTDFFAFAKILKKQKQMKTLFVFLKNKVVF